jgi:hypothetical protein
MNGSQIARRLVDERWLSSADRVGSIFVHIEPNGPNAFVNQPGVLAGTERSHMWLTRLRKMTPFIETGIDALAGAAGVIPPHTGMSIPVSRARGQSPWCSCQCGNGSDQLLPAALRHKNGFIAGARRRRTPFALTCGPADQIENAAPSRSSGKVCNLGNSRSSIPARDRHLSSMNNANWYSAPNRKSVTSEISLPTEAIRAPHSRKI